MSVEPADVTRLRDVAKILADAPAEYRYLHDIVSGILVHWDMGDHEESLVHAAFLAVLDLPDGVKTWLVATHGSHADSGKKPL